MTKISLGLILIVVFEKVPSLEFINKYNKTFGDESTVVAVNLLNGMYSSNKGINKSTSSFLKKEGIKEMKSLIYRILTWSILNIC
jgi:hypothetical protein